MLYNISHKNFAKNFTLCVNMINSINEFINIGDNLYKPGKVRTKLDARKHFYA